MEQEHKNNWLADPLSDISGNLCSANLYAMWLHSNTQPYIMSQYENKGKVVLLHKRTRWSHDDCLGQIQRHMQNRRQGSESNCKIIVSLCRMYVTKHKQVLLCAFQILSCNWLNFLVFTVLFHVANFDLGAIRTQNYWAQRQEEKERSRQTDTGRKESQVDRVTKSKWAGRQRQARRYRSWQEHKHV